MAKHKTRKTRRGFPYRRGTDGHSENHCDFCKVLKQQLKLKAERKDARRSAGAILHYFMITFPDIYPANPDQLQIPENRNHPNCKSKETPYGEH